jgi:hypothetical protein
MNTPARLQVVRTPVAIRSPNIIGKSGYIGLTSCLYFARPTLSAKVPLTILYDNILATVSYPLLPLATKEAPS